MRDLQFHLRLLELQQTLINYSKSEPQSTNRRLFDPYNYVADCKAISLCI